MVFWDWSLYTVSLPRVSQVFFCGTSKTVEISYMFLPDVVVSIIVCHSTGLIIISPMSFLDLYILPQELHQSHHRHSLAIGHTSSRNRLIKLARLSNRRPERNLLQLALRIDIRHDRPDRLYRDVFKVLVDVAFPRRLQNAECEPGRRGGFEIRVLGAVV